MSRKSKSGLLSMMGGFKHGTTAPGEKAACGECAFFESKDSHCVRFPRRVIKLATQWCGEYTSK